MYKIIYTKKALKKDLPKLKGVQLDKKTKKLIDLIKENPYANPPYYEKLLGVDNCYSRRINIHHRLVYKVIEKENTIIIISMWTHYEFQWYH